MNATINANLNTLKKTESLLSCLNNNDYSNATVKPYCSSIGSHIRHILDFYACVFAVKNNNIDLTNRERNLAVEVNTQSALEYFNTIIKQLKSFSYNTNTQVTVIDNLGLGNQEIIYTYDALLSQANSHTIHHYAIINYILEQLNITLQDCNFGYNPSTPKKELIKNTFSS